MLNLVVKGENKYYALYGLIVTVDKLNSSNFRMSQ